MSNPEYLSDEYFKALADNLRREFGSARADLLMQFVWALRHEHEKNEHPNRNEGK